MLKQFSLSSIAFFLFFISAFAQYPSAPNEKDAQGRRTGRWTLLYNKNFKPTEIKDSVQFFRVITYDKGLPSGRVYDYYISGALQTEMNLSADQPEDVIDGKALVYYEKGNIKYRINFEKGLPVGKHEEYYPNGRLCFTGQYMNGKADGLWEYFYDSGERKVVLFYKNGKMNGPKTMYSTEGKIIEKGQMTDDVNTGYWEGWFDNGSREYSGFFANSKKEGKWTFYYDNNVMKSTGNYRNNLQEGDWTYYHNNGQRKSFGTKKNDLQQGKWPFYFPGGQLEEIDTYVNDTLHGPNIVYYENGNVKQKGEFKKGEKEGYWEYFHENGKRRMTNNYKDGLGQGFREKYSEEGTLMEKVFFEKDSMLGPYFTYYEDGTMKEKGTLVNDKKEEWNERYYTDGKLKQKTYMHLDTYDGPSEAFYPNGNLATKGDYKRDTLTGHWENFHENGKLASSGTYVKGRREGYWEWYFDNGQLDGKGIMKNGSLDGYWEEFYANGKMKDKGSSANGNKQGFWTFYLENGGKECEGNYKDGNKTGRWNYYHSNGALSCTGKMDGGIQGPWVYYDSLGNKTSLIEFKNSLKEGKKTTYLHNKVDTVYIFKNDYLISIETIRDSIYSEIDKHHFKEAEALIEEERKMASKKYPVSSPYYHLYLNRLATLYSRKGDDEKAEKYSRKAIETFKQYHMDTMVFYAVAINDLANTYANEKRYEEAIRLYRESLEATIKNKGLNHIDNKVVCNNISLLYSRQAKYDSALFVLTDYREKVKAKYGEVDSAYYQVICSIADYYYQRDDYTNSNNSYLYLTLLLESQKNTNKAEYRNALTSIAINYQEMHQYDSLRFIINKAGKLYQSNKDTASYYYYTNWEKLGYYYSKTGQDDSSVFVYAALLERMKDNPYVNYAVYKNSLYSLATFYYQNDQYEEALKRYLFLKTMIEESNGQNDLLYCNVLQVMAYIYQYYYTDKNQEAAQLFETSVQTKKNIYGVNSTTYFYGASDLARFYSLISEFDKAIEKGKELLPPIEKAFGKNSAVYAHQLEALGDIYYSYTAYDKALPCYQSAYDYYVVNKQNEFNQYVDLAVDLGLCMEKLYKEDETEKIYLSTLQEIEKKLGKENLKYLKLTKYLVDLYMFLGREGSAKLYLKEALPIAKKITGEKGGYYFGYLNRLAKIELTLGEYAKSDSLLTVMKNISLHHSGAASEDYLIYLKEKANLEVVRENNKEAEIYYIQALKLTSRMYSSRSENYAQLQKKLAIFYRKTKRYSESEELLLKAKNSIESIYSNKLVAYAYYVEELARTYDYKGDFAKSEKYYDEAISIYEKENTAKSWNYLNTVNSKAKMYVSAGLYNKAKETFELYMKAVETYVGREANYALALAEIATIYRYSSSYTKASDYQKQSQKLIANLYSVEDSRYIIGLNSLGLIYLDANQLDSATYYFNEYFKLVKKLYPGDSLSYALYYNNYSVVCRKRGNFTEAEKNLNAVLRIEEKQMNESPVNYINFYDNYAQLYTSWGKLDKANKYWGYVLPSILSYTGKMFENFTEQEKNQFWSEYSKDFELYNNYCLLHRKTKPEVLQGMYDNRIATKAIVLNSINKLKKRIYSSRDSSLINKYEEWQVLKDRTARYYGVPAKQLKEAGISLDSMERLQERLEKDLNISLEDKKEIKSVTSWKDIQKKLLPGEAAVEIIRFRYYNKYLTDSVVYAALVLTANTKENPELIVFPYGNKLENRYLTFYRNAIKFKSMDSISYKAFWQPMEEKLKGINTLYLSLDGVYNQLNINTLMLPDGSYLLDKRKIIIVSNTKDILNLKSGPKLSKNNSSQGVHLFGFPDYDAGMDKLPSKTGSERDVNISMDFASKNSITKLPGTKVEMDKIVVLLADKQWKFRSYLSEQATEEYVKGLQSPLVLHIATHGFFLGEEQVKLGEGNGYMNGQKYNPLLMSGLMLTGATKSLLGYASQDGENGILTALEASTLNLDNTELVILSACETGKGEIKVGEGVYGLQRAFQVAGSKATIMSLWKVDDNATQQLMESFYRNWMASGNKTEAFRKAQMEVRQKYPSPYYWGAFVMMGE